VTGRVYLVGAGPGDPGLLTARALQLIGEADVILYDRLIPPSALDGARAEAELVFVGKEGGGPSVAQADTEGLILEHARAGRTVLRLKGGDPFVFGRGGEEVDALRAQGIEVEIIPGITAGTAVPASLGIPVTHREFARGVTFVTGHTKDGTEPDWQTLARSRMTLVIYMGLRNLQRILFALKAAGMDPATPACIIENGTLRNQKQRVATLGTLSGAGFTGPALIVIGDVVRFARAEGEMRAAAPTAMAA
jgi:uroporphyrin-III C-methyltransferase